jgi:energy-converting hydrogenase A subunit M
METANAAAPARRPRTLWTTAVVFAAVSALAAGDEALEADFDAYKRIIKEYYEARYEGKPDEVVLKDIARRIQMDPERAADVFRRGKDITSAYGERVSAAVRRELVGKSVVTAVGTVTLEDRVAQIVLDARRSHVVAYFKWNAGERPTLEEEASLAALAVANASTKIDTIALGAIKGSDENAVFTAKISREAASRIQYDRIAMFADKRYIRLFEEVTFK